MSASRPRPLRPGYPVPTSLRILLVEDRVLDGERVIGALEEAELWDWSDCYCVHEADHALEILARRDVSLILCDRYLDESTEGSRNIERVVNELPSRPRLVLLSRSASFGHPSAFHGFLYKCDRDFERMLVELVGDVLAEALPRTARPPMSKRPAGFDEIVGESPALVEAMQQIARAAPSKLPVFLSGESGTGKELFARALHDQSPRCDRKYLADNCAGKPDELLHSDLFGHAHGAFTGAATTKRGLVEAAHGGTLFLDEVGDMSAGMQELLLRFVETGEFRRLGSNDQRSADVRIVSATNRDIRRLVATGTFRKDLYYRLVGLEVCLPPLRERGADIERLAAHFLDREVAKAGRPVMRFSRRAMVALNHHNWPGNVRELENLIRRVVTIVEDAEIAESHLNLPHRREATDSVAQVVVEFDALGAGSPPDVDLLGLHGFLVLGNGVLKLRRDPAVPNAAKALERAYGGKRKSSTFNNYVGKYLKDPLAIVHAAWKGRTGLYGVASHFPSRGFQERKAADEPLQRALARARAEGNLNPLRELYPFLNWSED